MLSPIVLGLSVIRKTKRNYHKLKMVMSPIELHDEIYFEDSDDLKVTMDCEICDMENNLCYKVAKYLKEKYDVKKGIHIHINKKIPAGFTADRETSDRLLEEYLAFDGRIITSHDFKGWLLLWNV